MKDRGGDCTKRRGGREGVGKGRREEREGKKRRGSGRLERRWKREMKE